MTKQAGRVIVVILFFIFLLGISSFPAFAIGRAEIYSITPATAQIGIPLYIIGTGFGDVSLGEVKIQNSEGSTLGVCPIMSWNADQIFVLIPHDRALIGENRRLVLTGFGLFYGLPIEYTGYPLIYGIDPNPAVCGQSLKIFGETFKDILDNDARVYLGEKTTTTLLNVTFCNDTIIQVDIPSGVVGQNLKLWVERPNDSESSYTLIDVVDNHGVTHTTLCHA